MKKIERKFSVVIFEKRNAVNELKSITISRHANLFSYTHIKRKEIVFYRTIGFCRPPLIDVDGKDCCS